VDNPTGKDSIKEFSWSGQIKCGICGKVIEEGAGWAGVYKDGILRKVCLRHCLEDKDEYEEWKNGM